MIQPWVTMVQSRLCRPNPAGQFIAVEVHFFKSCLRSTLSEIRFDQSWYLRKYPDIRKAVTEKTIDDAHEHYLQFGFFEGRLPYRIAIDEDWYVRAYEDVKSAIQAKTLNSAQAHFEDIGFAEGRLPFPNFEFEIQK